MLFLKELPNEMRKDVWTCSHNTIILSLFINLIIFKNNFHFKAINILRKAIFKQYN